MAHVLDTIATIQKDLKKALQSATTPDQLEQVRVTFLGRNGSIAQIMKQLKDLSVEQKRIVGPKLNELKQWAQQAFDHATRSLEKQTIRAQQHSFKHFDVTASQAPTFQGGLHIYTHLMQQLEDIFISMGYQVADGPEIETDYYNFETLNIPNDHPARDMHDTFWVDVPGMLLRTHTSSIQAHEMEKGNTPLALFAPGRCYRNEATDASHDFMFTQAECLYIDKDVSMAHLLATARAFLRAIFETDELNIRVRPGYFPFVEPGVEIDASCPFCKNGCSTCKKTGWIELLGAGLVHPNVLKCSGIDPNVYSGFAFGTGLERIAMIKYGITDIRLFHSNKQEFLSQF